MSSTASSSISRDGAPGSSTDHVVECVVLFDGTGIAHAGYTGTGRVVGPLADALALARPSAQVVVVTDAPHLFGAGLPNLVVLPPGSKPGPVDVVVRPRQITANRDLESVFAHDARVVLFQFDTIAFDFGYHPSRAAGRFVSRITRTALLRADVVATLSRASLDSLLRFCPELDPSRVVVVPCGVSSAGMTTGMIPVKTLDAANEPARSGHVLVLAAAYEHKNRPFAVEVFAALVRSGYQGRLVIAGPEPASGSTVAQERKLAADLGVVGRVEFAGPVDEATRLSLLVEADAVLYPSLVEGFGLVGFEAAHAGVPALMADVSCFREVYGPNVAMADGFDSADWADQVMAWIRNPHLARQQVESIRARSHELHWPAAGTAAWDAIDLARSLPRRASLGQVQHANALGALSRGWYLVVRARDGAVRRVGERIGKRAQPRGYSAPNEPLDESDSG